MIYKLYSGLAGLSGLASIDIQDDGILYGVLMNICPTGLDLTDDFAFLELSFMSTSTFTTNDTRGSIAQTCVTQNFLTTGGGSGGNNMSISGLLIPVSAGERIFIHGKVTAGVSGIVTCYVYVDDGAKVDKLRPPSRRR